MQRAERGIESEGQGHKRDGGFFGGFRRKEKVGVDREHAEVLNQQNLIPILRWAYGEKDWNSSNPKYWDQEGWDFKPKGDLSLRESLPGEALSTFEQLKTILSWSADSQSFGHLEPPPGIVYHLSDDRGIWVSETGEESKGFPRSQVEVHKDNMGHDIVYDYKSDQAIAKIAKYYFNSGFPSKITPLIAKADDGQIRGVLTIRWRGDPFIPKWESRIAAIETLIVDPEHKREGIGNRLVSTALERAFDFGYDEKGAREVRAWIMQDEMAGDWLPNWKFFTKLKFKGHREQWTDYAKKRGLESERGEALWFILKKETYDDMKNEENPVLNPYQIK